MLVEIGFTNECNHGTKSNKDGTFRPKNSIVADGHCETVLLRMHCFVSLDTELLDKVFSMDSNLSLGSINKGGSTLAHPLHPGPWEAGAYSLTPPLSYFDWQGTPL